MKPMSLCSQKKSFGLTFEMYRLVFSIMELVGLLEIELMSNFFEEKS
jgi:hypothetical protein